MSFEVVGVRLVADGGAQYFGTMDKAEKAVVDYGRTTDRTFKQMPGLADMAVGAFHRIGAVAVDVFMQAGRAAVSFIGDSIGAAGDFESGMNKFAAVAGGALEESGLALKDFRDQFIQIGKELPVSTAEVQDAAIEMVKGGIEPATIAAGGLKQVIQFAAAADLDLAQASTIAAKALGGWVDITATAEEKAGFLTHSTDLLARAANASTVNVDDLALGLYNVQGTAKLAGLSFDETVTTLAQLAPSFASSADAGTSFKAFLSRLNPTTKPAIAAMTDLGLFTEETGSAFYDAQGQFIGMEKASAILAAATKGLSEEQKVQALQTIFGQDAIRVAAVLSEQGADGYNAMTAALEKQNSVQEMAAQKQAGFNTAMDNFKGSVEALQITIGSALLPVLTDLFNNYLAPGINILTDLAGALSGDADAFARLSPEMQEVSIALTQFWTDVQAGYAFLQQLIASFQATGAESDALGGVLNDLSGIWENLQGVIDKVMIAYQAIVDAVLPIVQDFIEEHGEEIDAFFQDTYDSIIEIINTALDLYEAVVPPTLEAIAGFIEEHGDNIKMILEGVWKMISSIINIALTLIKGIIKTALQVVNGDWEGAWETVKETGEQIWGNIEDFIVGQVLVIEGLFGDLFEWLADKAAEGWGWISEKVSGGIDDLVALFESIPGLVAGVGEAIVNTIWDGIRSKWGEVVDWFESKLEELRNQLPFSEPKDPSSPLRGLRESGAAIVDMLRLGMESAGPLIAPPLVRPVANPMLSAIRGAGTTNATYNQQRTTNLTYHTTHAPPANQSLALANALAGGF